MAHNHEILNKTTLAERCRNLEEKCKEYVSLLESTNSRLENEIKKQEYTEKKLKTSEARFRKIFEYAPIGAAIIDTNGKIVLSNKALGSMLAFNKTELVNMYMKDIAHEEDVDNDSVYYDKLIKKEIDHYAIDKRFRSKEGKIIWGSLAVTSTGDVDSNDNLIIAMVENISARIEAQQELLNGRNKLKELVSERTEEIRVLKDRLQAENLFLRKELSDRHPYGEIIGESHAIQTVLSQIELVAPTAANVLIQGESGTGKELVAREIHKNSSRSENPLIKVNCATIPKDLYESEFFGHVKGAFTGAVQDRIGRFEAADGGTLFLDEVGEIPFHLQSKMLRVLQEGEFERVGEGKTRKVNARIIAVTNKDLKHEVISNRFRDDLYYRLNVFPIHVAPLRERIDDITPLAFHFVNKISKKMNLHEPELTQANIMDLKKYEWPGNVRELENAIERAIILSRDGKLQFYLSMEDKFNNHEKLPEILPDQISGKESVLTSNDLKRIERQNTINALQRCGWKISGEKSASKLLGLKPTTLIERMKRWKINKPG